MNFTGTSPASDIMRFAGGPTAGSSPTIVIVDGGQAANSLLNTGIAGAGAINLTVGLGTSNSGNMGSDANMYGRINEAISNGALVRDPSSLAVLRQEAGGGIGIALALDAISAKKGEVGQDEHIS